MSEHTPGPWHRNIKPASKYNTIFAGRNTHVARLVIDQLAEGEVEANCNLIAAAPSLLALCVEMRDWLKPELEREPNRTFFWKLVDAIKRATGDAQ